MPAFDWSHPWLLGPVSFGLGFLGAVVLTGWRAYPIRQREQARSWEDGWHAGFAQGRSYERAFSPSGEYGPLVRGAQRLARLEAQQRAEGQGR